MDDVQIVICVMKSIRRTTTNTTSKTQRIIGGAVVLAVSVSALLLSSKTVHAGLVSFFSSIMGSERASAKVEPSNAPVNSQKLALLEAAANIDPNPEKSGDIVPVENGETLVADIAAGESEAGGPVNTQVSTYIVRGGDTISGIAEMFGVSVNTILWSNNLTSKSILRTGERLVILPISGITYTVKKGDTLQGIAKKYGADMNEVLAYNDLPSPSALQVGATVIIPNAEITISVPTKVVVGNNPAHDTNGPSYPGYYSRPIAAGYRTQGLHGYNGIDLADRTGTPIYASAAGTVIVSRSGGWNGGYGTFIIISHSNGTQTLYAHNSKNLVSVGDSVAKGQEIALMGATGLATGPHVHFEIRGAKNPF